MLLNKPEPEASGSVSNEMADLKDNGVGFDLERLTTGFGLQGMIERVQLLGGTLDIQTAIAQGTQIYVVLPP